TATRADAKSALADVAILEEFHAVPGPRVMDALERRLAADDAAGTAAIIREISEAILGNRDNATTLAEATSPVEDQPDLLPSQFGGGKDQRPSFETLFVTQQPRTRWPAMADELRRLRRREDRFIFAPVFVASCEVAVC